MIDPGGLHDLRDEIALLSEANERSGVPVS